MFAIDIVNKSWCAYGLGFGDEEVGRADGVSQSHKGRSYIGE